MPWVQMSDPKTRAAIQFIQILKDKNYITTQFVKKEDIVKLFKTFTPIEPVKIKFFDILQFMLYFNLVKKNKSKDKNFINFRPQAVQKILRVADTSNSKNTQNTKNVNSNANPNSSTKFNQNSSLTTSNQNANSIQKSNLIPQNSNSNKKSLQNSNLVLSKQNANSIQKSNLIQQNANSNKNSLQNSNSVSNKKFPHSKNNQSNVSLHSNKIRKKNTLVSQNVAIPSKKQETKYVTKEKCYYCNYKFRNDLEYTKHIEDIAHILRQRYRTNKKSLLNENMDIIDFVTERNGLRLTEIQSNINTENLITCKITNKNNNAVYAITDIILLYTQLKELTLNYKLPILLKSKNSQSISIKFSFRYEGTYILPIIFKIENKTVKNEPPKYLLKEMVFYIQSDAVKDLQPTSPYKRNNKAVSYLEDLPIIDGVPPPKGTSFGLEMVNRLEFYNLPPLMIKLINWGLKMDPRMTPQEQEKLVELRQLLKVNDRSKCLTAANYCKMLKVLLEFEEHQMKKDIRDYDCTDQTMKHVPVARGANRLLALEVPGLAENRPSLIRGDDLMVRTPEGKCYYKGYIHRVKETTVELGFFQKYVIEDHFDAQKYSVTFGFNRHTLRTEHQAVELTRKHNVGQFFFPTKPPKNRELLSIQFVWYQSNIKNNREQQQAVRHIVSGTSFPHPYLLFGPPGTGKTMTMVEAILQLWSQKPKSRILVAAPSNSAANEVTSRLLKYIKSKKDIFRMISVSFAYDKVPEDIKPFCNYRDGDYFYPSIETLESFRIVIVTLTAAAKFVLGGVTPGHFTHVFIDESGHSTESEVLIPIAGIITSQETSGQLLGQIVLAGDPKQLGPIIHSKLAKSFGFETSMLERLMNTCDVYQKKDNKFNPNMVTKLLKNFRSHKAILELPDEMFYDKELIAEGNDLTDMAIGWKELPNPKFPLIFHNVQGTCEREEQSPSYFNLQEIDVVMKYLENLVGQRLKGRQIKQSDIGIVSPYRKQVQKLQLACKKKRWQDILIGSVEQFQGQERLIIIISTVRSRQELVEHDYKFHLGFLKNPKRFNVAITRAKALVIVVGNPNILMWDKHWGPFIEYCEKNEALAGPAFEFKKLWLQNDDAINNNDIQNLTLENDTINNDVSHEHADFSRGNL